MPLKLSPQDAETFMSYVRYYGASCDCNVVSSYANADTLLQYWSDAKAARLYKAFGEKLILEKEIEYKEPVESITRRMSYELDGGDMAQFYSDYRQQCANVFGRWTDPYNTCVDLFNSYNLARNSVENYLSRPNYNVVTFPNGHSIKVTRGAKLMRLLGKICKELGMEEDFEKFRIAHSLILNQKALKGTLCLSIHPLDYITMSDNANGWTSCMSWEDDGDYRMGTVEMMNSPVAVVAYLKSHDKELKWDDQKWNSKLWRTLIVANDQAIISIKGYPYQSETLTGECVDWLKELLTVNCGCNFPHPRGEINACGGGCTYGGQSYRITLWTSRMYNDCGAVKQYGYLSDTCPQALEIHYSGATECMCCGADIGNGDEETNMVIGACCSDWEGGRIYCDSCDCSMYQDEVYWVEDVPLCEYCFDQQAATCDFSGDYFFTENMTDIYLADTDDHPDPETDSSIHVAECYTHERYYEESYGWLSKHFHNPPHFNEEQSVYYFNKSDIKPTGLRCFFGIQIQPSTEETSSLTLYFI